ncbi:MAG: serine/threonine-protein kinase [Bacteroidales bacterium]|jgi:serine/threonine protein kinase|nr:serine/threonine-protein kinase [Bacteroidales bacterium]
MNGTVLKGMNGNYLYFPEDESTILSARKFSIVYLGANLQTKKKCIIKRLHPKIEEDKHAAIRFLSEANIQVDHPAIINTLDLIVQGDTRYMVQEYIPSIGLKELIRENTVTSNHKLIAKISIKLLDAVQAMHEHGIIHRNIKPSNILIAYKPETNKINWDNPDVRLIDFDLSKTKDNIPVYTKHERRSPFSIVYSSPEILLRQYDSLATPATDLYSIGLIIMEMFTGEPAFFAENPAKLIDMQLKKKLKQSKKMYHRFFNIIYKATDKLPVQGSLQKIPNDVILTILQEGIKLRYKTAKAMKEDMIVFLKDPGEKPKPKTALIKKLLNKS